MNGIQRIAEERERQICEEGWTPQHDDQHDNGDMARAAVAYALPDGDRDLGAFTLVPKHWPWRRKCWKPSLDDRVRELVKAGALIAAEIDRLQRLP